MNNDKTTSNGNQRPQVVQEGYDRDELTRAKYDEAQKKKQNPNNNDKSKKPSKK